MISDARGGHVSPGIYTEEKDVTYSVKSLGITSLGLVGETLYGPAFENIEIENWGQFVDYFGGTSPEKFKGTDLPKYELPYIAKSYLEESKKLNVVRVLGLSGYHAGPAWVLSTGDEKAPVVILRTKMVYGYDETDICNPVDPDRAAPVAYKIMVTDYVPKVYDTDCVEIGEGEQVDDPSKFGILVKTTGVGGFEEDGEYRFNVSLNPTDSDYIYRVLSSRPDTGTTPIYIEAVYENSWDGEKISTCYKVELGNVTENAYYKFDSSEFFSGTTEVDGETQFYSGYSYSYKKGEYYPSRSYLDLGAVSTPESNEEYDGVVGAPAAAENFQFPEILDEKFLTESAGTITFDGITGTTKTPEDRYLKCHLDKEVQAYDDFCEMYRPGQTPWIVSDVSAAEDVATMRKLFKFITISDGDAANYQVKVSIQNIKPEEGTFDVVVRDFNDDDASPLILEKFSRCSLVEGDASYIAFKIGTVDGGYASKSKYIAVEMADGEDMKNCIPAGFLGYPMPSYNGGENESSDASGETSGDIIREPFEMKYYDKFDASKKPKRQYFGLNNRVIDTDILKYKGYYFYDNLGDANPDMICNGFHMDAVLDRFESDDIFVDGMNGYRFSTVSPLKVGAETKIPRLINASYINDTIYKDVALRKFTVYFYGGFDGWDVNRESRTNTDGYKASRYSVQGSKAFTCVTENGLNASLNLPSTAITTDYYAYLAGYLRFANPQDVDINVFATPGIDWFNNTLLTEDALEIIEDKDDGRGGDAIYVMAAPRDLDPEEVVYAFGDTEIDSSYAATYYPWVMYYDASNKRYIHLPVTKDVVRNMAKTDNESYPWFAPAGTQRGIVKCIKADYKTTINQEDALYEGRINPVKTFAQDGVKIWGNKTTYSAESPLNRVNVRRLMLRIKKLVSEAAKHLIFEQYDDTLEKQFKGLVEPILADVKANRGLYDYRVLTEVTPETRDQHILPCKILVKPTPALEYISISFVVYPESVNFEEN